MSVYGAIFLSYASQDADVARRICDALRAAGLEVWFDQSELRGGDAWDASIRKQIKECALFVPMISASTNSRSEGYFRLEWKLAVDRSHLMADDQPFFVPVILGDIPEPTARVPEKFRERQWTRLDSDNAISTFAARAASLLSVTPPTTIDSPVAAAQVSTAQEKPTPARESKPRDVVEPRSASASRRGAHGRRATVAAGICAFIAFLIAGGWYYIERHRKAVLVADAIPRIDALAERQKYMEAFLLAREAEAAGGGDALTQAQRDTFSREVSVQSEPPGAAIAFRLYIGGSWQELGAAPLAKIRVPRGLVEWRATLAGYKPASQSQYPQRGELIELVLPAENSPDGDMVTVNSGEVAVRNVYAVKTEEKVKLPRFLIDRTEVSNREYLRFVRAGGYAKPEYWKQPLVEGGKTLAFDAAMQRFRDATGRPGPAIWTLGGPPEGEEDFPVRGISWHEAAAYAAFAGKELPSLYHWYWADNANDMVGYLPSVMLPLSNFEGRSPRKVADGKSIGAFGAVNMAGNVREWIANTNDRGQHITLGGAWPEPDYAYLRPEPRGAFERPLDTGVRCMKRVGKDAVPATAFAVLPTLVPPSPSQMKPVSDAEYNIYKRLYDKKTAAPDGKVEASEDKSAYWTRQKVSYATGYNNERLWAYLYLPKSAKPPYRTIIHMGGSGSFTKRAFVTDAEYPGF